MASKPGIPMLSPTLIRPTSTTPKPPEPDDRAEAEGDPIDGEEGRGAAPEPRTRRRRGQAPAGKTRGRKLILPDVVFDRLQLTAIQRRTTASAVAAEILDRNLPRLRIERD
jgi:hypothetical protein